MSDQAERIRRTCKELVQIREMIARGANTVRRKRSWRQSEKAMTLVDYGRKMDAIDDAIDLIRHGGTDG